MLNEVRVCSANCSYATGEKCDSHGARRIVRGKGPGWCLVGVRNVLAEWCYERGQKTGLGRNKVSGLRGT